MRVAGDTHAPQVPRALAVKYVETTVSQAQWLLEPDHPGPPYFPHGGDASYRGELTAWLVVADVELTLNVAEEALGPAPVRGVMWTLVIEDGEAIIGGFDRRREYAAYDLSALGAARTAPPAMWEEVLQY